MQVTTRTEFIERRRRLLETIGEGAIAIVSTSPEYFRNGDCSFAFRPNSDFYYLTGFSEPEALLVLIPGRSEGEFILFNRHSDPKEEVWAGRRAGQTGAVDDFDADQSFPIDEIDRHLPGLLIGKTKLYYPVGQQKGLDKNVMQWLNNVRHKVRSGINAPESIINISLILQEMRLIKSPSEIAMMRHAAEVSAQAHSRAMQACQPGMMEYQLEAILHYEFAYHGCRWPAYTTIVGSGNNACTLHYVENNCELRDDDLVLIDSGGEYEYYSADITRTFPVNGRFTDPQKAIYEVVLRAQLACIEQVKPGTPWIELQNTAVEVLTEGLVELGLLKGSLEELITDKAYLPFYMHLSSHWLGMDTHDVGRYRLNGDWRRLQPGMVLTIEPGLYIHANCDKVAPQWRGIGIRIEDDILVTENGYDVLSRGVPKSIVEIEKLCQSGD